MQLLAMWSSVTKHARTIALSVAALVVVVYLAHNYSTHAAADRSTHAHAAADRLRNLAARPGVLRAEIGGAWLGVDVGALARGLVGKAGFNAMSRAQEHEDIYALEHFFWDNFSSGLIVESGALDGLRFSTSLTFEMALGWRALHIEPGPGKFELLARNRPRALNLHTALCDAVATVHFIQTHDEDAIAGIVEFMSPSFLAMWKPDLDLSRLDENPQVIPISCTPLRNIFAAFHITAVDFWVLDVEGGELSVLKTVD